MLLIEVMSSTSVVDWFVSEMRSVLSQAYDRAESVYDSTGDTKVTRMQAGMVPGRWYSTNVINKSGYSVRDLLNLLKPHDIKLPDILTDRRQKEATGYSSSGNLFGIIEELIPVLQKKGYKVQANILRSTVDTFRSKMARLLAGEEAEPVTPREPTVDVGAQRREATQIVQGIIQGLPRDVRHAVRTAVAARGNTLAALKQELDRRGLAS